MTPDPHLISPHLKNLRRFHHADSTQVPNPQIALPDGILRPRELTSSHPSPEPSPPGKQGSEKVDLPCNPQKRAQARKSQVRRCRLRRPRHWCAKDRRHECSTVRSHSYALRLGCAPPEAPLLFLVSTAILGAVMFTATHLDSICLDGSDCLRWAREEYYSCGE